MRVLDVLFISSKNCSSNRRNSVPEPKMPRWRTDSSNNEPKFAFAASRLLADERSFHNSDRSRSRD
jgi:hypothetical protein